MAKLLWSTMAIVFLAVHIAAGTEGELLDSPSEVISLARRVSFVLKAVAIDVSEEDIAACIQKRKEEPGVIRLLECLQQHGAACELKMPSEEEIGGATGPLLLRIKDGRWYSFVGSDKATFRLPAPRGEDKEVPWHQLAKHWAGWAITVVPRRGEEALAKPAVVEFELEKESFGKVPRGRVVTIEFSFKNVGEQPLQLKNASPEKKLVQIQIDPDRAEFPAGASGVLTVAFDTRLGRSSTSVTADLLTNDPQRMFLSLELKGEVVDPVATIPEALDFGSIVRGATSAKKVDLVSFDGSAFGVSKVTTSHAAVKATVLPPEGGSGPAPMMPLRVVADGSEMDEGEFEATCKVELDPPQMGWIFFPISGTVVSPDSK